MGSQGRREVHLLGFGEPAGADRQETLAYLERIFRSNARLDGDLTPQQVQARCHELAMRRLPGLLEDYERIGGSPLLEQSRVQARRLEAELARRDHAVTVRLGMQFTAPFVSDIAAEAARDGASHIVALPLYPLCGESTTIAAIEALHAAIETAFEGKPPRITDLTGWHAHPGFIESVAEGAGAAVRAAGVSLGDADTLLYFSAHGTPMKYLRDGSRYDRYVEEVCRLVADRMGVEEYAIGYQNHSNRGIEWTAPSNEELLPTLDATQLVVVPISFIHEQSETLVELDEDLRELAEEHGKQVIRVPVPFDATSLVHALADLVEPFLGEDARGEDGVPSAAGGIEFRPCQCRPKSGTWCLNGNRELVST